MFWVHVDEYGMNMIFEPGSGFWIRRLENGRREGGNLCTPWGRRLFRREMKEVEEVL